MMVGIAAGASAVFGAGPLAGASLAFHASNFTVGLDLSYHTFLSDAYEDVDAAHGLAAALRVGFGFWGR